MHLYCRTTVFCSHTCKKRSEIFGPFFKQNKLKLHQIGWTNFQVLLSDSKLDLRLNIN